MSRFLTVTARFTALPGSEGRLEVILHELAAVSSREAGCTGFSFFRGYENPREFLFIEEWDSEETFNAHLEAPHLAEAREQMDGLLANDQTVELFTPVR